MEETKENSTHLFTYNSSNIIREGDIAVVYEGQESGKQIQLLKN